jgi:hypothetical protein
MENSVADEIKPALNQAEWEYVTRSDSFVSQGGIRLYLEENYRIRIDESPAKIAALALYGQPFGFTREDVELLQYVAPFCDMKEDYDAVMALAAKVEALLPPEK